MPKTLKDLLNEEKRAADVASTAHQLKSSLRKVAIAEHIPRDVLDNLLANVRLYLHIVPGKDILLGKLPVGLKNMVASGLTAFRSSEPRKLWLASSSEQHSSTVLVTVDLGSDDDDNGAAVHMWPCKETRKGELWNLLEMQE